MERSWIKTKMPEEALELKKNLRCDMKARRNALTDEEKKHAAANCLSKLKELPEFMNADWIYAYIACRNELETSDIISWCLSYGKHVAVPMICDAFVLFLYNTIVPSEYYSKKTIYIMLGTSVAAVLNVVLNYIFIQVFGFVAAAYTTLAAYIVYLILHLVISRKLMGYFIVTPRTLLLNAFLVFMTSVIGLYFIDNIGTRYILGILIEMCILVKTIYNMRKAR